MEMTNKRIELITTKIINRFSFLEKEYHYNFQIKDNQSNIFSEGVKVVYSNESRGRDISISYIKVVVDNTDKYALSASILRTPYLSVDDFFSLDYYLNVLGINFESTITSQFNELALDIILDKMHHMLTSRLLKVIQGEVWLDGYHPRW